MRTFTEYSYHVYFLFRLLLWHFACAQAKRNNLFALLFIHFRTYLSLTVHLLIISRALTERKLLDDNGPILFFFNRVSISFDLFSKSLQVYFQWTQGWLLIFFLSLCRKGFTYLDNAVAIRTFWAL